MPTTLSSVDISNLALSKIGAYSINSLLDQTNQSSIVCNQNFQAAYLDVSRSARWNCLLTTAYLPSIAQTPLPGQSIAPPSSYVNWTTATFYQAGTYIAYGGAYYQVVNSYTSGVSFSSDLSNGYLVLYNTNGSVVSGAVPWAQFTYYQANAFLSYGNYYYIVNFSYTSTASFINDLTAGYLTQTDQQAGSTVTDAFSAFNNGSQYASGWPYQYQLPSNFQLLASLNETAAWDFDGAGSDDYEIMGPYLFANASTATIQYVPNQPDTTQFDALFTNALAYKLAAMIATSLRQDGGELSTKMESLYERQLSKARSKNGGEQQARRFNAISSSRFNAARFFGVNG
jgi:hypothetical protein